MSDQELIALLLDLAHAPNIDGHLVTMAAMRLEELTQPGFIKMPTSYQEASAMWLIGERWVRDNAPDKIKPVGGKDYHHVGEIKRIYLPDTIGNVGDEFVRDGVRWLVVGGVGRDGETGMCEVLPL